MSSQGHSNKDPGKALPMSGSSKNDKNKSATRWKHPTTPGSGSSASPSSNTGPTSSTKTRQSKNGVANKTVDISKGFLVPVHQITPPMALETDGINFGGPATDIPIIELNEVLSNSVEGGKPENLGRDNHIGHERGNNAKADSEGNNGQSPSVLSATPIPTPTHISLLSEDALENIFSFIGLTDIRNTSMVCQEWNRVIADENSEVWKTQCLNIMLPGSMDLEMLSVCPTFKAKLRAYCYSWNPLDCSRNIYVKPNGFTIHRNPVAQSTDGARGKVGMDRGKHAWDIVWEGPLGTVAVVGVATKQAEVRAQGYLSLIGKDDMSWGWNLVEDLLMHDGNSLGHYAAIIDSPRYQVGDRLRVILDCDANTLSFEKNFEALGVAFRDLPNGVKLYPAISAVYGNTEISMVYVGPPVEDD